MHKIIIRDLGLKLAEETSTGFLFYPRKMWRIFSISLFVITSIFTFFFLLLRDFQMNIMFALFVFLLLALSFVLFLVSLENIEMNTTTNTLRVNHTLSKKEIHIHEVKKILRITTKEYVDISRMWKTETNIRFFIVMNTSQEIQLHWPLKINSNQVHIFDLLINNLATVFNLKQEDLYVNKTRVK